MFSLVFSLLWTLSLGDWFLISVRVSLNNGKNRMFCWNKQLYNMKKIKRLHIFNKLIFK